MRVANYHLSLNIPVNFSRKNDCRTIMVEKRNLNSDFFSQLQYFSREILSLFSGGKKGQPLPFPILPKWYSGMDSHQYGILIFHRKYNNALRIFNSHKFPLFQNFANFSLFGKGRKDVTYGFRMNFKQSVFEYFGTFHFCRRIVATKKW